ncbi:MAG: hypothetical protein KGD68_10900 [Candidatus Lokiarchaeota archaeon]|nr:hypothetical protein [Candidatus Lokiarchaeota archaeon]
MIVENRFDIHPFTYITIFISYVFSLFLYLEVKEKKICIISDTKLNQKKYYDETGLEAFGQMKLKAGYREWLILTITENNHEILKVQSFLSNIGNYCFYCYFSIILIFIITVFSSIYLNLLQTIIVILVVFISIITICIIGERRTTNMRYKQLDSEIKRILFEEETGYSPLVKGKYTFKYKAWLESSEEKMRTVPYRN